MEEYLVAIGSLDIDMDKNFKKKEKNGQKDSATLREWKISWNVSSEEFGS